LTGVARDYPSRRSPNLEDKVLNQVIFRNEIGTYSTYNGFTIPNYKATRTIGPEPPPKINKLIFAYAIDGIKSHVERFSENPSRVAINYHRGGLYVIASTNGDNKNKFERKSFTQ
jgi:hypothetical protein